MFLVGVGEDLTGRILPRWRLSVVGGAALVGALWLGAILGLPFGGSWGVWHKVLSVAFTVFCVAGVTHSFNIIDGFNGLASGVGMIVLVALGWLAFMFGDLALCNICWGMAAAVFGFFLWIFSTPNKTRKPSLMAQIFLPPTDTEADKTRCITAFNS